MAASGVVIHMRSVSGKPLCRALDKPLICETYKGAVGQVPADFQWDGSSVPSLFQGIFPRHRHPIASCRHDWRCKNAQSAEERAWADRKFANDVGKTSWTLTKWVAFAGVRIGSFFGVGVRYPHWTDKLKGESK